MSVTDVRPFFVAGKQARGSGHLPVTHPPDGSHLADVSIPTAGQVDQAVQAPRICRRSWLRFLRECVPTH